MAVVAAVKLQLTVTQQRLLTLSSQSTIVQRYSKAHCPWASGRIVTALLCFLCPSVHWGWDGRWWTPREAGSEREVLHSSQPPRPNLHARLLSQGNSLVCYKMHVCVHSAFSVSFILVRVAVDVQSLFWQHCAGDTFGWEHHGHCTQTHLLHAHSHEDILASPSAVMILKGGKKPT